MGTASIGMLELIWANESLWLFNLCIDVCPEDVSLLERCPHFRGCYVQASVNLGPEDVSLLERCSHFRGCYVQASRLNMC